VTSISPRRGRMICSLGREPVEGYAKRPPVLLCRLSPIGAIELSFQSPLRGSKQERKAGRACLAYPGLAPRGYRSIVPAALAPGRRAAEPLQPAQSHDVKVKFIASSGGSAGADTGGLSTLRESPSLRRGEKGIKEERLALVRFPRVRQDSRRIFDSAPGRNAAAPLHPRLHSDAPSGRKR
jgi:hypothetical protein